MNRVWLVLMFVAFGCAVAQPVPYGAGNSPAADDAAVYPPGIAANGTTIEEDATFPPPPADPPPKDPSGTASDDTGETSVADEPPATADDGGATFDAGTEGGCVAPLAPGDLIIDELMIESVAGAGDYGEWLEVQSTLPCAVSLRGLHGECANGAKVRTVDVTDDVWIPAQGTFVIADSTLGALNHDLPGTVLVWAGQPGDALRNKGATVSLRMQGTVVDSVTYPALKLSVGASVAFPADCAASRRSDWTAWQTSTASFFPGFFGTPNAPNTDVSCP